MRRLVGLAARLRAERLVAESADDPAPFGLDAPGLSLSWSSGAGSEPTTLEVGASAPDGAGQRFARLSGRPVVFTIGPEALSILSAELRDPRLLAFAADRADRLTLRWPVGSQAFRRSSGGVAAPSTWIPEPGGVAPGLDPSRVEALVASLSALTTPRFLQYEGPIPPETGLLAPRLTIEVGLRGIEEPARLRIGRPAGPGAVIAALGTADAGAVFLLPAAIFDLPAPGPGAGATPGPLPTLPDDPFAPRAGGP